MDEEDREWSGETLGTDTKTHRLEGPSHTSVRQEETIKRPKDRRERPKGSPSVREVGEKRHNESAANRNHFTMVVLPGKVESHPCRTGRDHVRI